MPVEYLISWGDMVTGRWPDRISNSNEVIRPNPATAINAFTLLGKETKFPRYTLYERIHEIVSHHHISDYRGRFLVGDYLCKGYISEAVRKTLNATSSTNSRSNFAVRSLPGLL